MPPPTLRRERLFGPQITLQKLDLFCAIAELSSVTRAAERLDVAQPAVTAQLRDLEHKLGVKLVERRGRNIALTEAGVRVHRWATEILTRGLELRRELTGLADGTAGQAVIAASMSAGSYILGDLIAAFRAEHPSAHISLRISDTRLTTEAVRTGACDFAVLVLDAHQDVEGLTAEPLWDERLPLVGSARTAAAIGLPSLADIAALPFICAPRGLVRRELEDDMLHTHGVIRRRVVAELGHPEAIKRALLNGNEVSFIEETAVRDEIDAGTLAVIKTPFPAPIMPLFVAYRRDKDFTVLQRQLLDFVRQARPPGLGEPLSTRIRVAKTTRNRRAFRARPKLG